MRFYFGRREREREAIGCNFLFLFLLFFFIEHNRLAEEGYYLAIPSGRTKNFILSKREPYSYHPAFSLSPADSCFFSFSCRFSFLTSTAPVRSGATQLLSLAISPGFSSIHPSARVTRSGCASFAEVPRQQSKIKIQKSAEGKNRRKLDKSRPASAFFAQLPHPARPPSRVASLLFNSAVKRNQAGREGRAGSFRAFNARIADSRDSADDNDNNRDSGAHLCPVLKRKRHRRKNPY